MLSVETILYVTLRVELVEDPVSIILHASCKYYYFVYLAHLFQKLLSVGSYQEVTSLAPHFEVMDQGLVQIKDKGVSLFLLSLG